MADVLRDRQRIMDRIEGWTLCGKLREIAENRPGAPAYSMRAGDGWETLTFGEARSRVLTLASALVRLGLEPGDAVTLMMVNRPEHVLADLAAVHAGAVPISVYPTLAPEQVTYVAGDAAAKVAVLGGAAELERWRHALDALDGLRLVIVLDAAACPEGDRFMTWDDLLALGGSPDAVAETERRWRAVRPEDTVTTLYTSGTTGTPKGVSITHRNICYQVEAVAELAGLPDLGNQVSYLTYAHIAERVLSLYLPLFKGSHVHFCPDLTQLATVLREVRPSLFFGVPRVWEKIMSGLLALLSAQPDEQQRQVREAMAAGTAYIEAGQYGGTPAPEVAEAYERADAALLSAVRMMIGFDRAHWVASGAAPLSVDVRRFFAGLGVNILEVYGMTETSGAVSVTTPSAYAFGTAGPALPGMEVGIAGDGEILVRGPIAVSGYVGLQEATAELLDADGWLHTGDIGSVDKHGYLRIVDRKKELIITAGGENISPAGIEALLNEHPLVGQALAFGDRRPYPVAVLTLDPEAAPAWASSRGIAFTDLAGLSEHPDVLAEIESVVARANERLARVQQIKRWRLLPVAWSPETGELTPKLSLRRRIIHAKYADAIELLYA
jgi:long-chain acyl-CoA synthetase